MRASDWLVSFTNASSPVSALRGWREIGVVFLFLELETLLTALLTAADRDKYALQRSTPLTL